MGNDAPLLQLLDACYPALGIADHLGKEVGEAGLTELGRLGAVERAVVDGLAVGRVAQAGLLLAACRLARAQVRHCCGSGSCVGGFICFGVVRCLGPVALVVHVLAGLVVRVGVATGFGLGRCR